MIHMRIIGPEDQIVFPDELQNFTKIWLIRLERNESLAPEILRRLHRQVALDLPGEVLVFEFIVPPQPIRKPTTAGFHKRNPQLRMPLEYSAFNERQHGHHLFQRMRTGM